MQPFTSSRYFLLALSTVALGGCGSSKPSSSTPDAAADAPTGTYDTTLDAGVGSGGNGTGGAGGGIRIGTGGTVGIGGIATGGTPGTGGLGTRGTMPGSGGGLGPGGGASAGQPGTGGLGAGGAQPGTGGGGGRGGAATGGRSSTGGLGIGGTGSGTGGVVGKGGAPSGGNPGQGGVGTGGIVPGTGGAPGVGGAGTGGNPGQGGSTTQACPGSASYVGDSAWPDKLVVTAGAKYCGHFKEGRNLEQEYAAKTKLTIAPGTYSLPSTAGTYDFALPVCFERRPGEPPPVFAGAGQVKTIPYKSTVNTYASCGQSATQPITSNEASPWVFAMTLSYFSWTGTPQPPVLDGSILDHPSTGKPGDTNPGYINDLELCQGTPCDEVWQDVRFEACNPDYPLQRHTVTFTGGQIVLDMRITGQVGVAIMLAAFVSASGTLNSSAFTQTDYWKLIYSADHHHFVRNFAVLFDAPIGDACGLKVLNFYGNGSGTPEAYTMGCDLSNLAALAVTSATIELP